MLQKMRHTEEHDMVEVDSCVKLLDHEVATRRRRRNSMPFSLPSFHGITNSLSNLRMKSIVNSSMSFRRNSNFEKENLPATSLTNESSPDVSTDNTKSRNSQGHKKHLDRFTEDQKDEFFTTWRRIQGSRISLAE